MTTNITEDHRRAFEALTGGEADNFCLFSCYCSSQPAAAIAAVTVYPPTEEGSEPDYVISLLFISITEDMVQTDHDGRARRFRLLVCAFRRKAATDSNPKRPLIPI